MFSGDRQPESGELLIGGQPKRFRSPYDAVREGVVLVPGDRLLALLPNLSVRENLAVPLFTRLQKWLGIPLDEPQRVSRAIDRLAIDIRAALRAPPLRWQPAKGCLGALAGRWFSHAALL
ncbi:MAG: hypothetical protein R2867_40730 [Caldilineaceae bacterium]